MLIAALLAGCGGSVSIPLTSPTAGGGGGGGPTIPVPTAIAPAATQLATAIAPAQTQVATVVSPVETRVATAAAPLTTQVATAIDPLVSTLQAQEGGVRPNNGACPSDHPIKGRTQLLPPSRDYWLPGTAGYDQAVATICFANESDAQKALYRKATS